jgi:hypothetical protein
MSGADGGADAVEESWLGCAVRVGFTDAQCEAERGLTLLGTSTLWQGAWSARHRGGDGVDSVRRARRNSTG